MNIFQLPGSLSVLFAVINVVISGNFFLYVLRGKRRQQGAEPGQVDGHEIRFFTPVRRSVRIEKTAPRYPTALQEHDPCVTSLCDLAGESKEEVKDETQPQSSPVYVYRENEALRDHVHIKLVYPEELETW